MPGDVDRVSISAPWIMLDRFGVKVKGHAKAFILPKGYIVRSDLIRISHRSLTTVQQDSTAFRGQYTDLNTKGTMKGKIILEEHVCLPEENPAEKLKFFARDPNGLAAALFDLHGERLQQMNDNGVEYAIMSYNPPGPQGIRDPKAAEDYAIKINNWLAELVDRAPERFAAFAAVSMHDPSRAAKELTRCVKDLGMVGVMLHDTQEYLTPEGRVSEYHYDDLRYDEFWKVVESLGVPVYLHPKPPLPDDIARLYAKRPWLFGPTYSFARDCGFHFLALCTSGIFDRFPNLKLIIGHMGKYSRRTHLDRGRN